MPIVLSYEDVEALGSLAHQAGYQPAYAAARQQKGAREAGLLQAYDANRDAVAAQLLGIESRERTAMAAIAQRSYAQQQDQQAQAQQMQMANDLARDRLQATVDQTRTRTQGQIAQELLQGQQKARELEIKHGYEIEEIRERARHQRPGSRAELSTSGYPNKQQAEADMQAAGHLIPFYPGLGNVATTQRQRDEKKARDFAGLSTAQIQQFLNANPESEWAPYMQAIRDARSSAARPGSASGRRGQPEGTSIPTPGMGTGTRGGGQARTPAGNSGASGGYRGGAGYADPRFDGLSDAQMHELGQDPIKLQRWWEAGANVR